GKLVFTQIMDHLPWHKFRQFVQHYDGNRKIKSFTCNDQYRCMAFAQLTYRSSLRDIEFCLRAQESKVYHMGIRGGVARNTLANANHVRNWRIYASFGHHLIHQAQTLFAGDGHGLDLNNSVYALDSSTIDLCLSLFPWARFRSTKAAVKLHTLLDLRGNIPAFIHITDGKAHDINALDVLVPEPGAFYIMDRAYLDFARLHILHLSGAHFVLRAKKNTQLRRLYSSKVDRTTGLICDQVVVPTGVISSKSYPDKLRRIKFVDKEHDRTLVFLTNDFVLPALTITELYRARWKVELFFKWIKQNLRIKTFFGTSENAVKSQIWIAVSVYILIAIIRKRLHLDMSLHTILQVLSLVIFEKTPLEQLLSNAPYKIEDPDSANQLNLFD
ncbi:MAG: IS4 family transposase, partial [Alphaproteobacteria bacterium]|nr:IS4 family transposase [Alphaproteobacteria bacterium]